ANADRLYKPWRIQLDEKSISGLFRDHHLSDLIGFVYSRMEAKAAAADLHARLRMLGEKVSSNQPLTVCLFLDGENAWEYYPGNGREFLREFYRGVESDPDFRALTASEAITAAGEVPVIGEIFPGSWIIANISREFTWRSVKSRRRNLPSPSNAARSTRCSSRPPVSCVSKWTAAKLLTLSGLARGLIRRSAEAGPCMDAFYPFMRCATVLKRTASASALTLSRKP